MAEHLVELRWFVRKGNSRAVSMTEVGRRRLVEDMKIETIR